MSRRGRLAASWGAALIGFGLALAVLLFTPSLPEAEASTGATTSCGTITCTVSSSRIAVSDWESAIYPPSQGGSGGGSARPDPTRQVVRYSCVGWIGGAVSVTSKYPAANSGDATCYFGQGDYSPSGQLLCRPLSDRAANGRLDIYFTNPDTGTRAFGYAVCLYPTDAYAPVERMVSRGKIYEGGRGDFYLTPSASSASSYSSSGVRTDSTGYVNRGVDWSSPEAWAGAWEPAFDARTGTHANGQPRYGFYRLAWQLDYRMCERWEYPSWLQEPARFDCSERGSDRTADPFTYACNLNPALVAGIASNAVFDPARCRQADWRCEVNGDLLVGGQGDAVTVMRNGEPLQVTNPQPSVHGTNSTVVRNVGSWRYFNTLVAGSTPLSPSDPNASGQLFTASWRWDAWDTYSPTDTIAFYWASDRDRPFSWSQRYHFTADFYVPVQASVGGSTTMTWATSAAECPQVSTSPAISVVRSVSSP